ncbi:MAG: hypothetical protein NTW96_17845 [Planctomycetia bacterium]|nr:hypothetical protein [Planctomycetia bacterium]
MNHRFTRVLVGGLSATAVLAAIAACLPAGAVARTLPMPMLLPSDVVEAAGVRMEAQIPRPGMVLVDKDSRRPSLWYSPVASRTLADGAVQLWYQRVDKGEADYMDQRTLCLGEIRGGRWTLPSIRPESPAWGGPNNVVMTRSPHKPTWGGFNVFQIVQVDNALEMLYWDQPAPTGEAGAMRARSRDGKTWEKLTGTVFTEHNDAFCLTRIGDEYIVYQTALEPWPDKPFPDNLDKLRRVITLRTSPDLAAWSPQQPLLVPDARDAREAEFYLFKVFRYGHGYAGLIMKYYADPAKPGKHSAILRHELAVSEDGRAWQRPYRDTDLGFWSYADPFTIDGRMHFATWKDGAMVTVAYDRDRMVAVTGPGTFRTRTFARPRGVIALDADASQGWIETTLCDGAGNPVSDADSHRIEGIEGKSIPLPWTAASLSEECSIRVRLGDGARVFAVVGE